MPGDARAQAAHDDAQTLLPEQVTDSPLLRRDGLDDESRDRLQRVRTMAKLLDSQFTVPGTTKSFGLDALLGLIPGIGGAAGLVFSVALIIQAIYAGARPVTVMRMLGIAGADAAINTIPVVGTVADFFFKANERNSRIVATQALQPQRTTAESTRIVTATVIIAVVLVIGLIVGTLVALVLVARALF